LSVGAFFAVVFPFGTIQSDTRKNLKKVT